METAQYFLKQICQPFLDKGYFLEIHINQARLFSQILDTMNKAALVGYPLTETADRLKDAWKGEAIRQSHYEQAQECALAFRRFCLENNLLDFSLQIEIFRDAMADIESHQKESFFQNFQFLIADNLEEDVPVLHDLILSLNKEIPSMLLIKDQNAGFRSFLGADPISVDRLKRICPYYFEFTQQFDLSPSLHAFGQSLANCVIKKDSANPASEALQAYSLRTPQFYPQMITDVCQTIQQLIQDGRAAPADIAILSPYLPDSLKFSLSQKLLEGNIPFLSSRPSRSLADEPVVKAVLAFAKSAHPQWELEITLEELRQACMAILPDCDLIRASLVAQNALKEKNKLLHYYEIPPFTRERITDILGNQFDLLIDWIEEYQKESPLPFDIFLSRLFGEVLSQPGFALYQNVDAAALLNSLIQSARNFRLLFSNLMGQKQEDIGKMYLETLQEGLLPSASTMMMEREEGNAILISPAFTFLMTNRSVKYQFWLDIGNIGWWERLDQPLTHPYVLSRNWKKEKSWSDADEFKTNQNTLARLVTGLLDRCTEHVYLYVVGLNQAGINQSSPLLSGMQLFLKRSYRVETHA